MRNGEERKLRERYAQVYNYQENPIYKARKKVGLTRSELARALKVSYQSIVLWERSLVIPRLVYLKRLKRLFRLKKSAKLLQLELLQLQEQKRKELLQKLDRDLERKRAPKS